MLTSRPSASRRWQGQHTSHAISQAEKLCAMASSEASLFFLFSNSSSLHCKHLSSWHFSLTLRPSCSDQSPPRAVLNSIQFQEPAWLLIPAGNTTYMEAEASLSISPPTLLLDSFHWLLILTELYMTQQLISEETPWLLTEHNMLGSNYG